MLQDSEIQELKVRTQGNKEPINVAGDGKFDSPGEETILAQVQCLIGPFEALSLSSELGTAQPRLVLYYFYNICGVSKNY